MSQSKSTRNALIVFSQPAIRCNSSKNMPKPERAGDFQSQPVTQPMDLDLEEDFEFKRLKAMYRLLKDCGYTLRITKQEETVLTPREDSASTLPKAA